MFGLNDVFTSQYWVFAVRLKANREPGCGAKNPVEFAVTPLPVYGPGRTVNVPVKSSLKISDDVAPLAGTNGSA